MKPFLQQDLIKITVNSQVPKPPTICQALAIPEVAANYFSTPEYLINRLQKIFRPLHRST